MRKTEFGMSSLDTKQEIAIRNYHNEMYVMFEVFASANRTQKYSNRKNIFFEVKIDEWSLHDEMFPSYNVSLMSGGEFDVQVYRNMLIEPTDSLKRLLQIVAPATPTSSTTTTSTIAGSHFHQVITANPENIQFTMKTPESTWGLKAWAPFGNFLYSKVNSVEV